MPGATQEQLEPQERPEAEEQTDAKLFDYLNSEYGGEEDHLAYSEDEVAPARINKSGHYHGFITEVMTQKIVRQKATKTKAKGSIFYWLKPTIRAVEFVDNGKTTPVIGNVWPSFRYESGDMGEFDRFCIAARCKVFVKDGKKHYFPKADYQQGGAVGMPVSFTVEMKTRDQMRKDQETGQWEIVTDLDGNPQKIPFPDVINIFPWDTTERFVPEAEKELPDVPGLDEDDEVPF